MPLITLPPDFLPASVRNAIRGQIAVFSTDTIDPTGRCIQGEFSILLMIHPFSRFFCHNHITCIMRQEYSICHRHIIIRNKLYIRRRQKSSKYIKKIEARNSIQSVSKICMTIPPNYRSKKNRKVGGAIFMSKKHRSDLIHTIRQCVISHNVDYVVFFYSLAK